MKYNLFVISALVASANAINRGPAFPETILPGSEPVLPIPSSNVE